MGVGDRVNRARERLGPSACANPAPCRIIVTTELAVYPDCEERLGTPPPPLCATCPEHESSRPRVRWVEVVRDLRNRHGGDRRSGSSGQNVHLLGDEGEHDTSASTNTPTEPADGLAFPPSWPPDHPARLAAQGRKPEPRRAKPPGGRSDETTRIDPRDFGL